MAFAKKRVDDRKEWLKKFEAGTHVDYKVGYINLATILGWWGEIVSC